MTSMGETSTLFGMPFILKEIEGNSTNQNYSLNDLQFTNQSFCFLFDHEHKLLALYARFEFYFYRFHPGDLSKYVTKIEENGVLKGLILLDEDFRSYSFYLHPHISDDHQFALETSHAIQ